MMVTFLLGSAYVGNLKASLVAKSYEPEVKDMWDMIARCVLLRRKKSPL